MFILKKLKIMPLSKIVLKVTATLLPSHGIPNKSSDGILMNINSFET